MSTFCICYSMRIFSICAISTFFTSLARIYLNSTSSWRVLWMSIKSCSADCIYTVCRLICHDLRINSPDVYKRQVPGGSYLRYGFSAEPWFQQIQIWSSVPKVSAGLRMEFKWFHSRESLLFLTLLVSIF